MGRGGIVRIGRVGGHVEDVALQLKEILLYSEVMEGIAAGQ